MPRLAAGHRLTVEEIWVESDFTKPPDYLTLAVLIGFFFQVEMKPWDESIVDSVGKMDYDDMILKCKG